MTKFKVGDRVRTSGPFSADPTTGEVVSLIGSFVKVKIESGDVWSYRHSELEFVPVAEAIGMTNEEIGKAREIPGVKSNTTHLIQPLTIEAGKYYRTRDGRKVGPIVSNAHDNEFWPFKLQGLYYQKDGHSCQGASWLRSDKDDLIAEWVDEPVAAQQEAEQLTGQTLTSADGNTIMDVTNGVLTMKVATLGTVTAPTVVKGQLVKTPRGYGYELARFGQWSWVDTGNSQPVIITTTKLSAVAA